MKTPTNRVVFSVSITLLLAVCLLPGTATNRFLLHVVERWITSDIQLQAAKTAKRDSIESLENLRNQR